MDKQDFAVIRRAIKVADKVNKRQDFKERYYLHMDYFEGDLPPEEACSFALDDLGLLVIDPETNYLTF